MSLPINIPSRQNQNKQQGRHNVKAVVRLATFKFRRAQHKLSLIDVIEESMEELKYSGDAFLDDIADQVMTMLSKQVDRTNKDDEAKQLQLAQMKMDELVAEHTFQSRSYGSDSSWDPNTPPQTKHTEWKKILDVIDTLHERAAETIH